MTTRKVYGIASGSYSDYRVHCIVETEDEAKKVVEKMNRIEVTTPGGYGCYEIEEFDLVDSTIERQPVMDRRRVIMDDGREMEDYERVEPQWPWDYSGTPVLSWRWVRAPYLGGKGGRLEVTGTDHDLVRKVFEEKRAALLADDAFRAQHEMRGGI